MPPDATKYDFGAIYEYLLQQGKSLAELSPQEISRFEIE